MTMSKSVLLRSLFPKIVLKI